MEKPRSISLDLLIETSAHKDLEDKPLPVEVIQERDTDGSEMGETSYLVIGGEGETSTDDVLTEPQDYGFIQPIRAQDFSPSQRRTESLSSLSEQADSHLSLQTERQRRDSPKKNKLSSSGTRTLSPLPPTVHPSNQHRMSLQDSALSRLIDAVSLGNGHDTCGSISALIGQFEITADQTNLDLSSGSRPSKISVPPTSNHLSSTPLKILQESPQKAPQIVERSLPSSPETTEPAAFTILDEEELSPDSMYDCSDHTICNDVNTASSSRGASPSKLTIGRATEQNGGWISYRDEDYRNQYQSTGSSRHWGYEGYRETSINSTASDRFLMCHGSASSSLMEVEINVDGDPLDISMTLVPSQHDRQWNSDLWLSNHPSPLHRPTYNPSSTLQSPNVACLSSKSYKPTTTSHSAESSPFYRPCQSPSPHLPLVSNSMHLHRYLNSNPQSRYNSNTSSGSNWDARDKNNLACGAQRFQNGYDRPPQGDSCMPVSEHDVMYSSLEYGSRFGSPKQYSQSMQQNQALKPTAPEGYNGIYLAQSPSPCKSKSLGDLTSEDISCNFQSKYKVISRSFITPAMRDHRRMEGMANRSQSTDPLTQQLRKLVTLEDADCPRSLPPHFQPTPKPLSVLPPVPASSALSTEDPESLPPVLSRRLSSRSQSRVRHIASRARERQQDALKRPAGGAPEVVLRNKPAPAPNLLVNRHSTGSYIAGYLDQAELEDRGLPEGSCTKLRYGYRDQCHADDSVLPSDSCHSSEPEVYFLLRL